MLNPNARIIRFYKGIVLTEVYEYLSKIKNDCDKDYVDRLLKTFAGYEGKSCTNLSNIEMQELIEMSIFYFGELTEAMGERIEIKHPSEKHE